MIVETLNQDQFVNKFLSIRPDNFSHEGLKTLFTSIENCTEEMGEDFEFDPIAICCDFTEYDNLQAIIDDYDCINCEEDLHDYTTPIYVEGTDRIIILNF